MLNITAISGSRKVEIPVPSGSGNNLKEILASAGFRVNAPCGGNGICGKCIVLVDGKEELACTYVPEKDCTVTIFEKRTTVVRTAPELPPVPGEPAMGLGLALDIGTTTVAAFLYERGTGKCLGSTGALNAQWRFGSDVISRISYAENDKKLLQLTSLIREEVYDLGLELCEKASTPEKKYGMQNITYISIAGNTVMQHIFAAISPKSIGVKPFKPISLFGEELIAEPTMYYCPCISGYVGGDTTAGLLSTGIYDSEKTVLFADLGTNCEFALGNRDGFLCASAPAGHAFSGGKGKNAMFGSDFISLAAKLLNEEIIDETGRFDEKAYREKYPDGPEVKPGDIRDLQLAKASVRGAIETMLEVSGTDVKEISEVVVAGGFGMYLDPESAFTIGMFPEEFKGKIRYAGNAAGAGACLALRSENRQILKEIAAKCRYEELSASKLFDGKYIDAMMFGNEE